ncbi:MAG: hypothetical protein H0X62_11215, partial [Bacteroidetes bacterium]|nr:hypothetical protein [Bacteroidota bacterium]
MAKHFIAFIVILGIYNPTYAQTSSISGVINSYVKVVNLGSGSCIDTIFVTSTVGFSVNDSVMIIQMQGALINTSNTASFGSIISYNDAGNYEFGCIKSIGSNFFVLKSYLKRTYTPSGALQLVRIPVYNNVNVNGILTSSPWNGNTGGVLAFFASGTVTLNADINVSGSGFKGGLGVNGNFDCGKMDYFYPLGSLHGGRKGEGITAAINSQALGRGALANGGGGGNNNNAGGGGGSNNTLGGKGGEQVIYGT